MLRCDAQAGASLEALSPTGADPSPFCDCQRFPPPPPLAHAVAASPCDDNGASGGVATAAGGERRPPRRAARSVWAWTRRWADLDKTVAAATLVAIATTALTVVLRPTAAEQPWRMVLATAWPATRPATSQMAVCLLLTVAVAACAAFRWLAAERGPTRATSCAATASTIEVT